MIDIKALFIIYVIQKDTYEQNNTFVFNNESIPTTKTSTAHGPIAAKNNANYEMLRVEPTTISNDGKVVVVHFDIITAKSKWNNLMLN